MLLSTRFKRFLFRRSLVPPHKWRTAATVAVAIIVGFGFFLLKYSNAAAYLSDDPQACVNCHVMTPQYLTWSHSAHREVASCNDCHVPHNNMANKYFFKAKDGLYHATMFTMSWEPEVIRAKAPSVKVIQQNCIRCHNDQVTDAKTSAWVATHQEDRTTRLCWDCHREVPHGRVKSLSSVGAQIEPIKQYAPKDISVVPEWLKGQLQQGIETEETKNK